MKSVAHLQKSGQRSSAETGCGKAGLFKEFIISAFKNETIPAHSLRLKMRFSEILVNLRNDGKMADALLSLSTSC
jgi:hypothetical protein